MSLLLVGAGVVAPWSSLGWRCRFRSSAATTTNRSRFSSNAEAGDNSRSRRWWSDDNQQQLDLDDEFDQDENDTPWFSKVWNAYGYVLPLILASMLVVTGPQAFLMAMAIPLAQSAISFLLRYAFAPRNQQDYDDDYDVHSWESSSSSSSSSSSAAAAAVNEEPASTAKTKSVASDGGFGGWDELDDTIKQEQEQELKGIRRRRRTRAAAHGGNIRYREAPLLMRLLVAVFPFLGSWFRLL